MGSPCLRTWSRRCAVVMRSMPGAPRLRVTARPAFVALSRRTPCSIRPSCLAFWGEFREPRWRAAPRPEPVAVTPLGPGFRQTGVATAVGAPRCFGRLRAALVQVLIEFCSFVLRPFAAPGFRRAASLRRPRLTARGLSATGSPWVSADIRSLRAAGRYVRRSRTVGLRARACSPTVARLAARSCSYGRRLARGPCARVPCGSHLAVRLRWSSSPRRGPCTPKGSAPARRTSAGFPAGGFTRLSSPVAQEPATGKSPGLAGWKACATARFRGSVPGVSRGCCSGL